MARIEDYGLIGDLQTVALVGRDGSIDWACFPRFDSGACFAALLGNEEHGRWIVAPRTDFWETGRRYRERTLVLETEWETDGGAVRLIDFMPPRGKAPDIVRIVEGVRGEVEMTSELVIRFDYGSTIPWVRRMDDGRIAVAGPDGLSFRTPVEHRGENMRTIGEFTVREGDRVPFVLTWYPSNERPPDPVDPEEALQDTIDYWGEWADRCAYKGRWEKEVHHSLVVLKSLTYAPTGGIAEPIRRFGAGRVVPPGDVEALAAGARELLDDPAALEAARAGARRARGTLTWDAAAAAHLELYRQLV